MKRVLIADDEPLARRGIRQQLERHPGYTVVAEAADGAEAARLIRESSPDLIFLDIAMPLMNGFDVVTAVGGSNMPAFIFVTAYDQHALKAFDVNAVDYLLKPIDPARFDEALRRSQARQQHDNADAVTQRLERVLSILEKQLATPASSSATERIAIKENGKVLLIDISTIDKIESEGNYLIVTVNGRRHHVRETMHEFLGRATTTFVRVHRSIAVNRHAVRSIEPFGKGTHVLTLRDGSRVMTSYTYRDNIELLK